MAPSRSLLFLLTISFAQSFVFLTKTYFKDLDLTSKRGLGQKSAINQTPLPCISTSDNNYSIAKPKKKVSFISSLSFEQRLTSLLFKIKNERSKVKSSTFAFKSTDKKTSRLPSSCWALVHLLQTIPTEQTEEDEKKEVFIRKTMNDVIIQALRFAGDVNDYRYISTLMDACIQYHTSSSNKSKKLLLDTRLFGEAIRSLATTKSAGPSKLRHMWNKLWNSHHLVTHPPTAFELNTMIAALGGQHHKIAAAFQLYTTYCTLNNATTEAQPTIQPDTYTYSTLLEVLNKSIALTNANTSYMQNIETIPIFSTDSPNSSSKLLKSYTSTSFWQWRTALELLDSAANQNVTLNNFVYAAALKVNEQAATMTEHGYYYHNIAKGAMDILTHMNRNQVTPDVVTCTAIISALDKGKQWRQALALLNEMRNNTSNNYPLPNVVTYSCAISACARCGKIPLAVSLLDELRNCSSNIHTTDDIRISTWVYNSALAAYNKKASSLRNPMGLIQSFLDRMESDCDKGFPCAPDTVTYNIAFTILSRVKHKQSSSIPVEPLCTSTNAIKLFQKMKDTNIPRDSVTYTSAMNCFLRSSSSPETNLENAFILFNDAISHHRSDYNSNIQMTKIINKILEICANAKSPTAAIAVLNKLEPIDISSLDCSTIILLLLRSLSSSTSDYQMANVLIDALRGDKTASSVFFARYPLSPVILNELGRQPLEERHYVAMLTSCIQRDDLPECRIKIKKMKIDGIQPSAYTYETMALVLSKAAILHSSTTEFNVWKERKLPPNKATKISNTTSASSKAKAAKKVLGMIPTTPSLSVLSTVCRACASSGLWKESVDLLKSIHITFIRDKVAVAFRDQQPRNNKVNSDIMELVQLHRTLLSICARYGNVKASLSVVDSIQELERNITANNLNVSYSSHFNETNADTSFIRKPVPFRSKPNHQNQFYMNLEDWKLVMIAASKAKNWQVCLRTFETLRPYIEALDCYNSSEILITARDTESLEFAFTSAILCLEATGHYAWSIRIIHDWLDWSRSKPKKDALIAACRVIADSEKNAQVFELLLRVHGVFGCDDDEKYKYFRDVYSQVIGVFHKNGDYASADELYCIAVGEGCLPWAVVENMRDAVKQVLTIGSSKDDTAGLQNTPLTLDLHGMTSAIAHSAVRVALQQKLLGLPSSYSGDPQSSDWKRDIIIVTGRGKHSTDRFRPILRPQVQQMLTEEFYPPLSSSSMKGNMGALQVPAADVNAWLLFHKQQRSAQMLALADVIRNISSGTRLIKSLQSLKKPFSKK